MTKKIKRLGDMLTESGLVSHLQVDQALQAQQIFGGRLGTNLIEMGAIDYETLAGFLSQQCGVPRVLAKEMENIPKDILDLVPARAAQRLCILPIARNGRLLTVVMLDPTDERVRERVTKNIGMDLDPRIATEIEIRYYLEKYYDLPRETRHIQLMQQSLEKATTQPIAPGNVSMLSAHLDRYLSASDTIEYFFEQIKTLEKTPTKKKECDLTKYDLTPEVMYIFLHVDGISSLSDLLAAIPLPRILTLRTLTYLHKLKVIEFDI